MSLRRAPSVLGVVLAAGVAASQGVIARDFGQAGQVFPIAEPDLLATIETRLTDLQASGGIEHANAAFARRAAARIRRPVPVAGLLPALETRTWTFDPAISLDHDVFDQKGNTIARAGQRINPLDFVTLRQALVFIDGDDPAQLDWATRRYAPAAAKIILVAGSPIDAMTARQRRFYFDQDGRLSGRLGIGHTPAVAVQAGKAIAISEIALGARAGR